MTTETQKKSLHEVFGLDGRVVIITGGAGLLGRRHADAVALAGGIPVIVDLHLPRAADVADEVAARYGGHARGLAVDITDPDSVARMVADVLREFGRIDALVNNAANNPAVGPETSGTAAAFSRVEQFPLQQWQQDIAVGLTGAFLCSRAVGGEMARRGGGAIVNIASDLGIIAPDQRIYRQPGTPDDQQPVKPITYSVVKAGLIGMTRYFATYWADRGVRVNALCPGGVFNDQPQEFVGRLSQLIPMGRMARVDEYEGAILFLCSDAASYMTGSTLIVDGGRTCW